MRLSREIDHEFNVSLQKTDSGASFVKRLDQHVVGRSDERQEAIPADRQCRAGKRSVGHHVRGHAVAAEKCA